MWVRVRSGALGRLQPSPIRETSKPSKRKTSVVQLYSDYDVNFADIWEVNRGK